MSWQLVAHYDDEIRALLRKIVRNTLERSRSEVQLVDAQNAERAREGVADFKLEECSLIVIGATMPASANVSMGKIDRTPTMEFIGEVRSRNADVPVIVVSAIPDDLLAGFLLAKARTALVAVDDRLDEHLAARIGELHEHRPSIGTSRVQLDIQLSRGQGGNWQLRRTGRDPFEAAGPLLLNSQQLTRVLDDSERLDRDVAKDYERDEWHKRLGKLSHELRVLLFEGAGDNIKCWNKFLVHRERAGGIQQSRVRITVDETMHPMLLEALRDDEDEDYWALNAPVYRRYARNAYYPPLFKDSATRHDPVNVLVIEADPDAGEIPDAPGGPEFFDSLRHTGSEARAIVRLLSTKVTGGIVRHLSIGKLRSDPVAAVLKRLDEKPWHIVHFCGHTSGRTSDHAGLVLRADRGGILPIRTLVQHLARTQLLFLSSCRSASTKIVMHAVERHVPAILGFQWVIGDEYASEFAREFYRRLFAKHDATCYRYLEYACMGARRAVHDKYRQDSDPVDPSPWVAPMLIMQMG